MSSAAVAAMATATASALPPLPVPSNYTPVPGRLFGWGAAKRPSAFPGAKTIDATKHICYPGARNQIYVPKSMRFHTSFEFSETDTKTEIHHKSECRIVIRNHLNCFPGSP